MKQLHPGTLLLSDPFLKDPNFQRSVIFICEHNESGSFGLVLNKKIPYTLGELVDRALGIRFPVYEGGPVQPTAVHFLHTRADIIPDAISVHEGIYWGGQFEEAVEAIRLGKLKTQEIRFFVGYSGWSENQLQEEYDEKSWILADGSIDIIFEENTDSIWKKTMHTLGGEYALMVNYPTDPQLN
ncbi:MAG: YqgE/AlgH family protein [Sediminibacterium sp.]|nr:YqgE/AlgH family protein [Sediminibacterium sp.]MBX9780110.1 YqgE/AlgH family protein [Chitinophagaceae bacterium]